MNAWLARAIQFSIFPSPPWDFDPFPPGGGRWGWGGEARPGHATGLHPHPHPLTLPHLRGREKTDRRGSRKLNDPAWLAWRGENVRNCLGSRYPWPTFATSQGETLWIGHSNCSLAPMGARQKDQPGTARPCYSPISRGAASCGTIPTPAHVRSSAPGRTAPTA